MKRKIISTLFALVLACSLSLVTAVPVGAADIITVDPGESIQAAIDAANPAGGDTITVAAGTYNEQVVIDKQLTLQGANAGVNPVAETRGAESIIDGGDMTAITISADGVIVDGFTLDGGLTLDDAVNPISGGILSNSIITGADSSVEPIKAQNGIRLGWDYGLGVDGFTIENNTINNSTEKGIRFANPKLAGEGGMASYITISGNEIKDNLSAGIETYGPGHNTIINNTISGNGGNGINLKFDDGDVVTGNIITNNTKGGIILREVTNATVENNSVSGHLDQTRGGIWVREGSIGNIINYNDITGNYNGILIERKKTDVDQPSGNSINFNNISGNTNYGILNALVDPPAPVDATNNWWGNPNGPSATAFDLYPVGDAVSDNVTFSPWLYHPHPAPSIATSAASSVTTSQATLNGNLNSLGSVPLVNVSFEWGTTTAYGRETTTEEITSIGSFSFSLSGLSPDTTYHFRAKAAGDGTSYGIDSTFTTGTVPTVPPALTTDPAITGVTTTLATLNVSLTDLGTALSVEVSFEWGETSAYGNETTPQTMTSTGAFSFSLSGLSSGTTYHFRAKAVGDATTYGIDSTFTTRARAGGGFAPSPPARPPAPPVGTTDIRGQVSDAGVFLESVSAASEDGLCTLTIPEGTVGLTEELEPLTEMTTLLMDEPPPPPEDAHVIGLAYDLGPDGATFEPPITLTFSYDPDDIPEGIAEEDLAIAYYDQATGEWVELEDCVVDTENNTITASVSHFTAFAIIGAVTPPPPPPPTPARFWLSNLTVQPAEVQPKEAVTITVSVANTGGTEGSYTIVLKINDVKEAEKSVTVAALSREMVTFSVTKEETGSYSVTIDSLGASFSVVTPEVAPEVAPEEEVAPPEEEEVVPEVVPINWPLIGGIIAAVIVIGLLAFFLVRRRAQVTKQ